MRYKKDKNKKDKNKKDKNKKDKKTSAWSAGKKAGVTVLTVAALYALISVFFQFHFFPGTEINGHACGFRSVDKVKEIFRKSVKNYGIQIKERDNKTETVTSAQVGLSFTDDGKLEQIKAGQKAYAWITFPFVSQKYPDGVTLEVDETSYTDTFHALDAFNEEMVVAPVDAWSRYDKAQNAYVIVEEIYGNTVKKEQFYETLKAAIIEQRDSVSIEEEGCYENPVYKKDSPEVVESNETLNRYVKTDIVYDFDDRTQELTGKKIHKWLTVTKKFKVKVDEEKAAAYVANMAEKYDTVGIERHFTSIIGNEIDVEGGTYGWKIDQAAETEKLIKQIKKGKQVTREPEYEHYAKSRKKNDIGDTYVEVDLGSQHMWFYKDGKTLVSTPVVTGNTSLGRGTPTGVYFILYKTTNYTLTGENYANEVDYWLPFTHSGVGIHDASWRSSYGGGIYTYNGSHGCVNTPYNAVRTIYNNIESTYPVVVHW